MQVNSVTINKNHPTFGYFKADTSVQDMAMLIPKDARKAIMYLIEKQRNNPVSVVLTQARGREEFLPVRGVIAKVGDHEFAAEYIHLANLMKETVIIANRLFKNQISSDIHKNIDPLVENLISDNFVKSAFKKMFKFEQVNALFRLLLNKSNPHGVTLSKFDDSRHCHYLYNAQVADRSFKSINSLFYVINKGVDHANDLLKKDIAQQIEDGVAPFSILYKEVK